MLFLLALRQSLLRAAQHNCDVSDAQHAGSYTLCIYLTHMREYFRWHEQLWLEAVLGELMGPAATTRGDVIWIRRESLCRVLWEMIDEWCWKKPRNAMSRVLNCYGFAGDAETALKRMTDESAETIILHQQFALLSAVRAFFLVCQIDDARGYLCVRLTVA